MTAFPPSESITRFSSAYPIILFSRPATQPEAEWQEVDRGPGYFSVPVDYDIAVRIKSIDNAILAEVIKELQPVAALRFLDLAENRNVTNEGVTLLKSLPQLTQLSLSSCSVSSTGLAPLKELPHLTSLDLSYCNRLSDGAIKILEGIHQLTYVNVYRCLGISTAAFSRVRRQNINFQRDR